MIILWVLKDLKDPDRDIFPDFYEIDPEYQFNFLKKVTLPDENRKQFELYDFDYYNQVVKDSLVQVMLF